MVHAAERRKYFKKEARFVLRYSYFTQIFMLMIISLTSYGMNTVKLNIIELLELEYSYKSLPVEMLIDFFSITLTLPLYIGVIKVNSDMSAEPHTGNCGGMFEYFSSGVRLYECMKFIVSIGVRVITFFIPFTIFGFMIAQASDALNRSQFKGIIADSIMAGAGVVFIASFIGASVFMMRYFAAVYIFVRNPGLTPPQIIKKSVGVMRGRKIESIFFILSFGIWFFISYFLLSFLFVFFTLPYFFLSYNSFMSFIIEEAGGNEYLSSASDVLDEKMFAQKYASFEDILRDADPSPHDNFRPDVQGTEDYDIKYFD